MGVRSPPPVARRRRRDVRATTDHDRTSLAAAAYGPNDRARLARAPTAVAIALAGCAASACSIALAYRSDHIDAPGARSALMVWVVLLYVVAGAIAWWRRPQSRFGLLLVAAGFAIFLSSLSWANAALPFTVGIACDLLPAVLFLHVFLAFPTGRLEG